MTWKDLMFQIEIWLITTIKDVMFRIEIWIMLSHLSWEVAFCKLKYHQISNIIHIITTIGRTANWKFKYRNDASWNRNCVKCRNLATWTTGWRRLIGCLKLLVIFCKRATNYRALLRKVTYADEAFYGSLPRLIMLCLLRTEESSGEDAEDVLSL